MLWNFIVHGRFIPNYFCGANLYDNGRDHISPSLSRIPLYRKFDILLICGFLMVVDLSFYVIDIYTVLQMLCYIKLHVRVIYVICLDHLEEIVLSALTPSLIFLSSSCIYISVLSGTFVAHIYLSGPIT